MRQLLFSLLITTILLSCNADKPKDLSLELAQTIMQRYPDVDEFPGGKWSYPKGYVLNSMAKMFSTTHDSVYYHYIMDYVDMHVDAEGKLHGSDLDKMDNMMTGSMLVWAYVQTGDERYRKAADEVRKAFDVYPRSSEGLFLHMERLPGEVWVDGVFMGQMFLTKYGKYIGDSEYCFNEAAKQLIGIFDKLEKNDSGLLYHAWDEDKDAKWADPETGYSSDVWSEGLGWYSLIIVETLEIFPEDHPQRKALEDRCIKLMHALKGVQDPETGLWYQVVDKGHREENWHDTSGSAMFMYAIKKAGELGIVDAGEFSEVVEKAYAGVRSKALVNPEDGLIDIVDACQGVGVQLNYDVYINYPKTVNAKEAVPGVLWGTWIMEKPGAKK